MFKSHPVHLRGRVLLLYLVLICSLAILLDKTHPVGQVLLYELSSVIITNAGVSAMSSS